MWLNTCLEEIEGCRTVSNNRNLLATCIVNLRHLIDERNDIAKELHQAAHTHVFSCTDTEHREDGACDEALAYTLAHLVLCELLCLEEFLHQCIVVLSGSLYESLVHLCCLFHLLSRDILNDRSTTFWLP